MEGGSARHLEPSGLAGDVVLGVTESSWGLLSGSKVALPQRQGKAGDTGADRPDGGWAETQRGRPPTKVEGRPSQQGRRLPRLDGQRIDCEFITCRMSATDTSWMLSHHQANCSPVSAEATVQLVQRAAGWTSEPVTLPPGGQWASQKPEPSFRREPSGAKCHWGA